MAPAYDPLDLLGRGSPRPISKPRARLDRQTQSRPTTPAGPPGLGAAEFPPLTSAKPAQPVAAIKETIAAPAKRAQSKSVKGKQKEAVVQPLVEAAASVMKGKIPAEADNEADEAQQRQLTNEIEKQARNLKSLLDDVAHPKSQENKTAATEIRAKDEDQSDTIITDRRQNPGKLDIAAAQDAAKQDFAGGKEISKKDSSRTAPDVKDPASNIDIPSRTATPTSAAPAAKAPRTIRVVDTPKVETPVKSAVTGKTPVVESPASTSLPGTKAPSRRPSIGSINIPSTPNNELHSETASYTESHPASPSGGKPVLPTRVKTKSMAKKEARKRKEESKLSESMSVNTHDLEPVQEAIVGRKKKAKKEKPVIVKPAKTNEKKAAQPQDTPVKSESDTQPEASKQPSPAQTPAEPESPKPQKPLTAKERIDRLSLADLVQSMTNSSDLAAKTFEMFTNPPNWKTASGTSRAHCPLLTDDELAKLDGGEPVLVESEIEPISPTVTPPSHPYPYTIILPNPSRTILPMATKAEGELYLNLHASLKPLLSAPHPSYRVDGAQADSDALFKFLSRGVSDSLANAFTSLWDIFPEYEDISAINSGRSTGGASSSRRTTDDLLRNNPAAMKWATEDVRALEQMEALAGGNYFARRRAAALGHGPVSLDSVAAAAPNPSTATNNAPVPPGNVPPTVRPRGTAAPDSSPVRRQTGASSPLDLETANKAARARLAMPIGNKDPLTELVSLPGLADLEKYLASSEEVVGMCKRELEREEKKFAAAVRRSQKVLKRAGR